MGLLPFRIYAQEAEKIQGWAWTKVILPTITSDLSKDERVVLIPEDRIEQALRKAGNPEIDETVAREIGREIDADLMILGSITQIDGAISVDARIMIFDEPTTSLTARETERLFDLIARLHAAGKTIIYITHILRDVLVK